MMNTDWETRDDEVEALLVRCLTDNELLLKQHIIELRQEIDRLELVNTNLLSD